mmetsp:Transcript_93556/g.183422  ORF Transcript_93556/g.183422 Transcript_93556/m.183422 type:complete len:279 (+) Transcript_93556:190-1026(+)
MSANTHLIVSGFEATASIPRYRNLWLCDAKWFELMRYHVREMKDIEGVTLSVFIRALNRHYKNTMDVFTPGQNTTGVFHMSFTMPCPIQDTRRKVHFYYVTKKGTTVSRPTEVGLKFTEINRQTIVPLGPPLARNTAASTSSTAPTSTATSVTATSQESHPSKRARIEPLLEAENDLYYWKSPEAAKLFLGIDGSTSNKQRTSKKQTDGEDTSDTSVDIERTMADRIAVLQSVQQETDGWKKIVYTHDATMCMMLAHTLTCSYSDRKVFFFVEPTNWL